MNTTNKTAEYARRWLEQNTTMRATKIAKMTDAEAENMARKLGALGGPKAVENNDTVAR